MGYVLAYITTRRVRGRTKIEAAVPTSTPGSYSHRSMTTDATSTPEVLAEIRRWLGEKSGRWVAAPSDFTIRSARFFLWEDGENGV